MNPANKVTKAMKEIREGMPATERYGVYRCWGESIEGCDLVRSFDTFDEAMKHGKKLTLIRKNNREWYIIASARRNGWKDSYCQVTL